MCLVFSISKFFINKIHPANKLRAKKIPSSADWALDKIRLFWFMVFNSAKKGQEGGG